MYLGVDIGGTKTLVAVLDANGQVTEKTKFPTPQAYDEFLTALGNTLEGLKTRDFQVATIAVPGHLDRQTGMALDLGNLPWHNIAIQADCEQLAHCPVIIENDAKLAGLSEAMLHKDHKTVLYVTVSTGIGTAVVHQQVLDPSLQNSEGGHMLVPYQGELTMWEQFASGKAIYEHFGKKAMDIPATDTEAWGYVARNLSLGLFELMAVIEPDLIVIGGSIGSYFERFEKLLAAELKRYETPLVPIPRIVGAERAEDAVIYGCYDLAKQVYPHAATTK